MKIILILISLFVAWAYAEDGKISGGMDAKPEEEKAPDRETTPNYFVNGVSEEPVAESTSRDPASQEAIPGHKATENELRVMPQLPEAQVKRDTRSLQGEVYKSLYNRELKQDQREDVLDE